VHDGEAVIQWYPGHMVRSMRRIAETMRMVDVVIEVLDARIPIASSNPSLDTLIGRRSRIVVLSHDDVADMAVTARWIAHFASRRRLAVAINAKDQQSVGRVTTPLAELLLGRGLSRAMVVGIPNTGKSAVINGLLRRNAAKTEDRAGLTRTLQWFRLKTNLEIMDTPGLLVPKIDTPTAQWMLALCGCIPRERYDPEDVAIRFHTWLVERTLRRTRVPDLESFARTRGFIRRGDEADMHNAARSYIKDFSDGKFGRLSFEDPPEDPPVVPV